MKLVIHEYGLKSNPAVVFLHGLGVSSWMWQEQIEALKDEYNCLAIDLPGNGESYQAEWVSFNNSAQQVAEIIRDKTKTGMAHVVGLSLGGYTAVTLLANYPDTVHSMIVSGITTGNIVHSWLVRPLTMITPLLIKFPPMVRLSARMMQFPEEVVPLYVQDASRLSSQTIRRIYKEVLTLKLPKLPQSKLKDLLISAGDKEAKAVLNTLTYISETFRETAVVQAPNAHHGWNGEHPDLFSNMIRTWIPNEPLPEALKIISLSNRKALVPSEQVG
ncbi:MAG: alpha/beta fold hydrolase [Chloroflexota bacterium]